MCNFFRCVVLLLALGMMSACEDDHNKPASKLVVKVCYIPISASNVVPITIEDISKKCIYIGDLNNKDDRFLEIYSYIKNAPSSDFDGDLVRVQFTLPNSEEIYINKNGEVLYGGLKVRLKGRDLAKVQSILDRMEKDYWAIKGVNQ